MLILASASKARRRLLNQLGIDFEVIVSQVDENRFKHSNVKSLVKELSIAKAQFVSSKILLEDEENSKFQAVLGCDSLFEFKGNVFGKPKDDQEAIQRWKLMSAKTGILHTGHCLLYRKTAEKNFLNCDFKGVIQEVISTKINFSELTHAEIEDYVRTKEPMNCAGCFALEGKGAFYIKSIEGCYSNVIGLSLPWLRNALAIAGIDFGFKKA
ncbi:MULTISPECIES: nucleoside triphosphate pyrophosphatase [unclassified Prochlorococcus]|uniref:nucleoside triphosphate pyrophosphatase n=1 Tax=unclassified Prochlorococcus TaxID=2627481 RepID=UPI0005338AA4|nr:MULTISPECIES: nucleoside triphosphate pyrophosphatase [unclassified Prochlorococcus]KGG15574.1 Septum formation protein Maf [Prochlorococcus sp. MIT 0602]KGG17854.1 Septum formation protein Maf [Prochlorococcus sp. MIT 0603]